jgi:hypothetical protein
MALHSDLPIHRTGVQLLTLAIKAQAQMPRAVKRHLGDKLQHHCMEMLDRMALANATHQQERAAHIQELLKHQRAAIVLLRVGHDARYIPTGVWSAAVQLLDSVGKQGGGWLKKTSNWAPAA